LQSDAHGVVAAYLRSEEVVAKNKSNEIFETALRVFVDYQQTPIHPVAPRPQSQDMFDFFKQRYAELYGLWDSCKQEARVLRARYGLEYVCMCLFICYVLLLNLTYWVFIA
jgi:hypothetical protein